MTRKSFGMLSVALVCATAMSISISSCDSNNTPTTPGSNGGVDRGKGPQTLGNDTRTLVEITEAPVGGVTFSYNEDGDLKVAGLNGAAGNAVSCAFAKPINVWHAAVDAKFTEAAGSLTIDARDDAGNVETAVTIQSSPDGSSYVTYPTFTSHPDGGAPLYDVYVYNNGQLVGSQLSVAATQAPGFLPSLLRLSRD